MKKIMIIAAMLILTLSGCKGNIQPAPTEIPTTATPATAEPTEIPTVLIQAENVSKVPDGWTVVSKYKYDFDGDGDRETLRLCTDAQSDADGLMAWDDSHNWVLEMSDASNIFTLYKDYIHTGMPSFEVYQDSDGKTCVNLSVITGAGYSMKKFIYIKDKKAFEEQNIYNEEGINHLYSSVPMYD